MGQKWFVATAYRYRESGNWEFKAVNSYDSFYAAKNAFHERKAAITKDSNDFVLAVMFDMYGNMCMKDFDDTHTPEPEPNEE